MSANNKYYYVSSADRVRGNESNFAVDLPMNNVQFNRVSIANCRILNSWYNVTSDNNGIRFTGADAAEQTVSITAGYYTQAEFMTAVKNALDTADSGVNVYTVSLDDNTKLVTISANTNNFSLHWNNAASTANVLLGFTDSTLDTGATTYTGNAVPNMERFGSIFVESSLPIAEVGSSSGGDRPALAIIDVNAVFGEVVEFNSGGDYAWTHRLSHRNIGNQVGFRLVDENDTEVDLNGVDWSMVLYFQV